MTRQTLVEAHIPEHAVVAEPAVRGEPRAQKAESAFVSESPSRPLRLFERPEPIETLAEVPDGPPLRFRWRRMLHEVAAIEGPERIAAPWWRAAGAPTRDYFRAEDSLGRRYWLYREGPLWPRDGAGEMVLARGVWLRKTPLPLRERVG